MLQESSAETFLKQLLDIGDRKVALHILTILDAYNFPNGFCTIINSQNDRIDQIFPDIHTQYLNHKWLADKSNFASKICGCQRFEFQDTTVVARGFGVL